MLAHGLSAVRDQRLPAYAERFAAAGLAALLFDYRHFGASGGEPRQLLDIGRQLEDWRTAIAYARGLEGIERVGAVRLVFRRRPRDRRRAPSRGLAAVVAQCPMTDGLAASLMMPPLTAAKLTKVALQDAARRALRPQAEAGQGRRQPGELALMTAPDVVPGFEAITPPDSDWLNVVAARASACRRRSTGRARRPRDRVPDAALRLRRTTRWSTPKPPTRSRRTRRRARSRTTRSATSRSTPASGSSGRCHGRRSSWPAT